ncbi:MAG: hypothetical protein H6907_05120 [Hyphomicrobiales bacterium]|nr:hypothetical protein [Hyphomicrobiales bacterium]
MSTAAPDPDPDPGPGAADDPVLARALGYPYPVPDHSYLLTAAGPVPLAPGGPPPDLAGRTPVLATGSNRAPEQLARKFEGMGAVAIPVIRCRLWDFDAVYSAHFARYGAIPAVLRPSPGTAVELAVTWLTDRELAQMHATEALGVNYDAGRAEGVRLEPEFGPAPGAVWAYVGRRGYLDWDGAPVALAEVAATGRTLPAAGQAQVQRRVHGRLGAGTAFADFVRGNAGDDALRAARIARLAATAHPGQAGPFVVDPRA